jgi:signal transduction histidine kinase
MTTNFADTAGGATPDPTKEKAFSVERTEGPEKYREVSEHFNGVTDERKAFATLQAQFALREVSLVRMADGVLYASRWGQIIMLADMAQALKFLDKIGGAK